MSVRKFQRAARSLLTLNRDREFSGLMELLALSPGDRVLDVGSGDGFWTSRFGRACGSAVGLEPDYRTVCWARDFYSAPNVTYVVGSAEALPFPDGSFDKVVSVSCLEHFGDPDQGLREMARVLKPGGRLALSADSLLSENSSVQFRAWHKQRHFVTRYFDEDGLETMMVDSGLKPEPDRTMHLFRSRLAGQLRRLFIVHPRLLLPLFPFFYALVRLVDRRKRQGMHGQIVIATGTR